MTEKVVVFHAGKEEYAIPIPYVISIEKIEAMNPVPHLPVYMVGITKARGTLIPVLDLSAILYGSPLQIDKDARMIVIHTDELAFGLLVKEAKEIIEIPHDAQNQLGLVAYEKTKYFSSIAQLTDRLITMIDPVVMLDSLEGIKEVKDYLNEQKQEA
ncbi:chemotaxis protein CheW [Bacillus sp. FJAT-50079]|uniref:chemotaxis protein CheW n=1 Tax=Bacillus sp. FJAT-50079 TaxID=2833577 RepID=UPI001BC9B39A|nr:chemotaxis protein CheW [Bacillus sp. FJAT-50079]MBS4209671.1 chemotaxis protein CheW [Bacillus sp. FJAT-50079]